MHERGTDRAGQGQLPLDPYNASMSNNGGGGGGGGSGRENGNGGRDGQGARDMVIDMARLILECRVQKKGETIEQVSKNENCFIRLSN